jgi:hypothetical protein
MDHHCGNNNSDGPSPLFARHDSRGRVLVRGDQQHIRAYHEGVDLGGPAMARIARDYGYTLAELRKL